MKYHTFIYPSSVTIVQSRCPVQLKEPAKKCRATALPISNWAALNKFFGLIWNFIRSFLVVFWLSWKNLPRGVAGRWDSNPGLHDWLTVNHAYYRGTVQTELLSTFFKESDGSESLWTDGTTGRYDTDALSELSSIISRASSVHSHSTVHRQDSVGPLEEINR